VCVCARVYVYAFHAKQTWILLLHTVSIPVTMKC
jgi:hypothetical protein